MNFWSKNILITNRKCTLTVVTTPSDATCTLTYNSQSYSTKSLTVPAGATVTYSVYHATYGTVSNTITMTENKTLTCTGTSNTAYEDVAWQAPHNMTANGTLGGSSFAVEADSQYSDRAAYRAFNGSTGAGQLWESAAGYPHYLTFYNPNPVKLTSWSFIFYYSGGHYYAPTEGHIDGSNDGTNWTQLKPFTASYSGNQPELTITNITQDYYKYYRFSATNSGYGYLVIQECYPVGYYQSQVTTYSWTISVEATPKTYIYGFKIDTTNSDPTSAVTYIGDNEFFTPASMDFTTGEINYGSWANAFFQPRPVMVKYDGTVDYELSKNDFTKKADGVTASDVSNTSYGGNCMIGFPQVWMKFVESGNYQYVYIANRKIDNDYHCYTHQNKNGDWLNEIYLMAFEPSLASTRLRSLSGRTIYRNYAGTTMQTNIQNNGSSWDFMDYGEVQMLQMLCVLMFKSLDSQRKIGAGVVNASNSTYATTGATVDKGMFYSICNDPESENATTPIKVFGIENLWGSRYKWINGLVATSSSSDSKVKYKLCDYTTDGTTVAGYSTTGTGYNELANSPAADVTGFVQKQYLNSKGLFAYPDSAYIGGGTSSTYYCDRQFFYSASTEDKFAAWGGGFSNKTSAGLFTISTYFDLSQANALYGASLTCKPL